MICFLLQQDAKLGIPKALQNSSPRSPDHPPAAPPRWLLSQRWLTLTDCKDHEEVNATIDTLLALRWNINAPLNHNDETMLDIAYSLHDDDRNFKMGIVGHLKCHGSRSKKQMAMSRVPTMDV